MQANNNEWLSSFLLILSSLWLLQCRRCWRVPEEIWVLITTEHRGWYLPEWERELNTNQREGCFKSAAGNWMIWSKRRQCSASAKCTGQRAYWCGSVLCKLIYTTVMKNPLIHLIPFLSLLVTVPVPRTWSHRPSGSLTGPRNRYLFYRKWNRRHWNNSCSVLLSRPQYSGCFLGHSNSNWFSDSG